VAKFLVLWRRSATAWPTDPVEYSKLVESSAAWIDDRIKKGEIKEHAHFLDGTSGYTICEGEATDILRALSMTVPNYDYEVHEFIPYEKSRRIVTEALKARAEAAKKATKK
jgi:hypothetical protein